MASCGGDGNNTNPPTENDIDTTPDLIEIAAIGNVAANINIQSRDIIVAGINQLSPISIIGGLYSIDHGNFTNEQGQVGNGQTVNIQILSSSDNSTTTEAILIIGGISSVFSVTTRSDNQAPTVEIIFPTPKTTSDYETLTVRGVATDATAIQSITVNGVEASSSNNFLNWQAQINLQAGINQLSVISRDNLSNVATYTNLGEVYKRSLPLGFEPFPGNFVVDNTRNRLVVLDEKRDAIYAIDRASKELTLLYEARDDQKISNPYSMVVDPIENIAYITPGFTGLITQVDLATGERSTPEFIPDPGNSPFNTVSGLALDSENSFLYISDLAELKFFKVDLNTNEITTVASSSTHESGLFTLFLPRFIAGDFKNNKAYTFAYDTVSESSSSTRNILQVFEIDLNTGIWKTVFLRETYDGPQGNPYRSLTFDDQQKIIYLIDANTESLLTLDLEAGTEINTLAPDEVGLIQDVFYDNENDVLLVAQNRNLYEANKDSEIFLKIFSSPSIPVDSERFSHISSLAVDQENNFIYTISETDKAIHRIDILSGTKESIFINSSVVNSSISIGERLTFDKNRNRLFVANSQDLVYQVNLDDNAVTILREENNSIEIGAYDPHQNDVSLGAQELFVSSSRDNRITSINLENSEQRVISDNSIFPGVFEFSNLSEIEMDTNNNRLFALDSNEDSILKIDIDTGSRSLLSNQDVPNTDNPFGELVALAIDADNGLLVAANEDVQTLFNINIATGERTILSNQPIASNYGSFIFNSDIAIYSSKNIVFGLITGSNEIIEIDTVTGERVILAN